MLKKSKITIILFLILLIVNIYFSCKYIEYNINIKNKKDVACYLNKQKSRYVAVLDIPKISFSMGLTEEIDIDKNISFIKDSVMPDSIGYTIIAGHSGNNYNSYFNNLDKLKLNDNVYLYFNNIKYKYTISDIKLVDKTGKLSLRKINDNKLILITCKRHTDKQIIITCNLIQKEIT